jgi:predicted RNase H-like nuclease (RuvC/YqgF family)
MDALLRQNNESNETTNIQPHRVQGLLINTTVTIPHTEYMNMCNKISTYEAESNRLRVSIDQKDNIIKKMQESEKIQQQKIDDMTRENKKLRNKVQELENQIKNLRKQLRDQNELYGNEITELKNEIKNLKNRDDPITVRKAFVALEKYMMVEITGSKTKAREYYGLKDLFKDKNKQSECDTFLSQHGITRAHVFLIPDINDIGNTSAHANRPIVKREDWLDFAFSTISHTYDLDEDEKQMVSDLLKLLEIYNPVKPGHDWAIIKPY